MLIVKTLCNLLSNILESNQLIKLTNQNYFYDEPKLPLYFITINHKSSYFIKNKNYVFKNINSLNASGVSSKSDEIAKFKCIMEFIERLSLYAIPKKNITIYNLNSIDKNKVKNINISLYHKPNSQVKLGWVEGTNLKSNSPILIPAQLVYPNYRNLNNEPLLNPVSYNGAASGLNKSSTLLHGLYELIERDSFMTAYLKKIPGRRINLDKINDESINKLVLIYQRYQLRPLVFDITNDLLIPSFVCFLIDESGIGPALTVGARTNLDPKIAILDCLEEAFLTRPSIRKHVINKVLKYKNTNFSNLINKRALYWSKKENLKKLNFWFKQKPKPLLINDFKVKSGDELNFITEIFKKKGFNIYYIDIKMDLFKHMPIHIYRVIVPQLQPLYLSENQKYVKLGRIEKIVNNIPHPLL